MRLPDTVDTHPGHQAGSLCGAGLSGQPALTLGFDKRWSLALAQGKAAFIDAVTGNIPPRPADMETKLPANRALAA